jgi:hypothetical protein
LLNILRQVSMFGIVVVGYFCHDWWWC